MRLIFTCFFLFVGSTANDKINPYMRINARFPIACKNTSTLVNIQPRNQLFKLTDLLNGSVRIDFDEIPRNHILLTLANEQSNQNEMFDHVDCWTAETKSMVITNLTNETYTFCLMNRLVHTVSPLDCLSFLNSIFTDDHNIWLNKGDKPLAVGLLVMGIILSLLVGFGIGVIIVRRQFTVQDHSSQHILSTSNSIMPEWKQDNAFADFSYPYEINDENYVAAVNPSRFDVIKRRLEKSENSNGNEVQYDLEDMPYAKAPSAPEPWRDSGISTGPIYAISSKTMGHREPESNGEDLYLCVDQGGVYCGENDENSEKKIVIF